MSSPITHTHRHTLIKIHPLARILDICATIFSSCALFTVHPNRIITVKNYRCDIAETPAKCSLYGRDKAEEWAGTAVSGQYIV